MKRLAILIVAFVALLAACGDGSGDAGPIATEAPDTQAPQSTTTTPTVPTTTPTSGTTLPGEDTTTTTRPTTTTKPDGEAESFVTIYLVADGLYAEAVPRSATGTGVAAAAVRTLIEGATAEEKAEGLSSAVPTDTLLLGLTIRDGLATVDLSREFEAGGGSFSMLSRLAQVVYTLTEFDSVDRVLFWLDGEPVSVFSGEGIVLDGPVTRAEYASALPIGKPRTEARVWEQDELPGVDGAPPAELRNVVLVAGDDVLNVRQVAGVDGALLGMLHPDATVRSTGRTESVSGARWAEIRIPGGTGWVNGRFLTEVVPAADFAEDDRVIDLLDEFATRIENGEDFTDLVSSGGLWISHHAPPVRFTRDQLEGILDDPTTYRWPSPALEPDSPENPARTFSEAIADNWLSVYTDDDVQMAFNEPFEGPNGRLARAAIPVELSGFNYVMLHDPGDNPEFGGLDWFTWYVSIAYEGGTPKLVGLTIDQWAP